MIVLIYQRRTNILCNHFCCLTCQNVLALSLINETNVFTSQHVVQQVATNEIVVNFLLLIKNGYFISCLVMEMVGPKYRTVVGVLLQVSYSIGFMVHPVAAYFIRDDFYLQIATMAPGIAFIPYAL